MPNWKSLLDEIKAAGSTYDSIRRKYIGKLYNLTKRNTIVYYSGWLSSAAGISSINYGINDNDKNGFMSAIHGLDKSLGLDLILHTPGGDMAATESLVDYLKEIFGTDIRAIIPQIAMSGGTMIACACKEIIMGKHSSLGPIDPQILGTPAHGIIQEFETAKKEITANPKLIPLWQQIVAKYSPALIGECQKSITWAEEMVEEWLTTGMFKGEEDSGSKIKKIMHELGDHAITKSHHRHISKTSQRDGLKSKRTRK